MLTNALKTLLNENFKIQGKSLARVNCHGPFTLSDASSGATMRLTEKIEP